MQRSYPTFTVCMVISFMLSSSFSFAPQNEKRKPTHNHTHQHPERTHKQQPRTQHQSSIETVLTEEEHGWFRGRRDYALFPSSSFRQKIEELQALSYFLTAVTAGTYVCNIDPNISHGCTFATLISFCVRYQQERQDKKLRDEAVQWFANHFPSRKIKKLQKLSNLTIWDQQFVDRVAAIQSKKP